MVRHTSRTPANNHDPCLVERELGATFFREDSVWKIKFQGATKQLGTCFWFSLVVAPSLLPFANTATIHGGLSTRCNIMVWPLSGEQNTIRTSPWATCPTAQEPGPDTAWYVCGKKQSMRRCLACACSHEAGDVLVAGRV